MSLDVVAVHLHCNLCERNLVFPPVDPEDPLSPTAVPEGWRSFAERPGGRIDRHWCPNCVSFIEKYERQAVKAAVSERLKRTR